MTKGKAQSRTCAPEAGLSFDSCLRPNKRLSHPLRSVLLGLNAQRQVCGSSTDTEVLLNLTDDGQLPRSNAARGSWPYY